MPDPSRFARIPDWFFDEDQNTSVDAILRRHGRRGGATRYGWHTRDKAAFCHRAAAFARRDAGKDETLALQVGSVVHEYLAELYSASMEGRSGETVVRRVQAIQADLEQAGWSRVAADAGRLFYAYRARYLERDEYLLRGKVVGVERELRHRLPWGEMYSGRADLIVEQSDGFLIVDHKTSADRGPDFLEGWVVDPGMLGLCWLLSQEPELQPVVGLSINGIIKTKEPGFDRRFYRPDTRLVREYLDQLRWQHAVGQLAELSGNPPNFAACFRGKSRCAWFDRCVYGLELGEESRSEGIEGEDEI